MDATTGISFGPLIVLSVFFLVSAAWQILYIFMDSASKIPKIGPAFSTMGNMTRFGESIGGTMSENMSSRSMSVSENAAVLTRRISSKKTLVTPGTSESSALLSGDGIDYVVDGVHVNSVPPKSDLKEILDKHVSAETQESLAKNIKRVRSIVVWLYFNYFLITLACGIVGKVAKPGSTKMMVLGFIWAALYLVFMIGTAIMPIKHKMHVKIVGIVYCLTYVFVLATLYMFFNGHTSNDAQIAAFYNTGSYVPSAEQLQLAVDLHWLNNIVMILGIAFYIVAACLCSYQPEVAALLVVGGYSCLAIVGGYFVMIISWVYKAKDMESGSAITNGHQYYNDMGMVYFWVMIVSSLIVFLLAYCKKAKPEMLPGFNDLVSCRFDDIIVSKPEPTKKEEEEGKKNGEQV